MSEIIETLIAYKGSGWLIVLYGAATAWLFAREKDKKIRILFLYLPLLLFICFLLPPVYRIYTRIEDADTYYRLLWLLPQSAVILYSAQKPMGKHLRIGLAAGAAVLILCGTNVYQSFNLVPAENRLHLPSQVISVVDTITNDSPDKAFVRVVMPAELIPFVRQYESRIRMPYGREMLTQSEEYTTYNAIYEEMEGSEVICVEKLVEATRAGFCNYIVINMSRELDQDPEEAGLELVSRVDGYLVYRDPEMQEVV